MIASILIITFIAQDIAWAYPDSVRYQPSSNNKLAPQSFFRQENSIDEAYIKVIEYAIEKAPRIPKDSLTLAGVNAALQNFQKKDKDWFDKHISYTVGTNEILINIAPGHALRYYEFNNRLHKELLNPKALPASKPLQQKPDSPSVNHNYLKLTYILTLAMVAVSVYLLCTGVHHGIPIAIIMSLLFSRPILMIDEDGDGFPPIVKIPPKPLSRKALKIRILTLLGTGRFSKDGLFTRLCGEGARYDDIASLAETDKDIRTNPNLSTAKPIFKAKYWDWDKVFKIVKDYYKKGRLLTREEEKVLGREKDNGNGAAWEALVYLNKGLVLYMFKKFKEGKRLRFRSEIADEMLSGGQLRLAHAAASFDWKRNYKFSTYACRAILRSFNRTYMEYMRYNRGRIRPGAESGEGDDAFLSRLKLPKKTLVDGEKKKMTLSDLVDTVFGDKNAIDINAFAHILHIFVFDSAVEDFIRRRIDGTVSKNPKRDREILLERLKGGDLYAIGHRTNLTRERVRQIQNNLLRKLNRTGFVDDFRKFCLNRSKGIIIENVIEDSEGSPSGNVTLYLRRGEELFMITYPKMWHSLRWPHRTSIRVKPAVPMTIEEAIEEAKAQPTIGDRIRILRTWAGITQKEVGNQLGISQIYASHIERGRIRRLSHDIFTGLAAILAPSFKMDKALFLKEFFPGARSSEEPPKPAEPALWRNDSPRQTYSNEFNEKIEAAAEMLHANRMVVNTPLIPLKRLSSTTGKQVFLKDESGQRSGSFKIRGVLIEVDEAIRSRIEAMKNDPKLLNGPFYIVTQTTGNHGVALIEAVRLLIERYRKLYPELADGLNRIEPVIFTTASLKAVKKDKMLESLNAYRRSVGDEKRGAIDESSLDYNEAKVKREAFISDMKGNATYMEHGGFSIMAGHASAGIEIDRSLRESGIGDDKKVTLVVPVGAGGPVGVGAGLKLRRPNAKVVLVQTEHYSAFVRSLISGKIEKNRADPGPTTIEGGKPIVFEDGIAVDGPEKTALDVAKTICEAAVIVNPLRSLDNAAPILYKELEEKSGGGEVKVGGTTAATVEALLEYGANLDAIKEADAVILFGTEGNIDPDITERIRRHSLSTGGADGNMRGNEEMFCFDEYAYTHVPDLSGVTRRQYEKAKWHVLNIFKQVNRNEARENNVNSIIDEDSLIVTDLSPTLLPTAVSHEDGRIEINSTFVRFVAYMTHKGFDKIAMTDAHTDNRSDLLTSMIYSIALHEIRGHYAVQDGIVKFRANEGLAQMERGLKYQRINVEAILFYWLSLCENNTGEDLRKAAREFLNYVDDESGECYGEMLGLSVSRFNHVVEQLVRLAEHTKGIRPRYVAAGEESSNTGAQFGCESGGMGPRPIGMIPLFWDTMPFIKRIIPYLHDTRKWSYRKISLLGGLEEPVFTWGLISGIAWLTGHYLGLPTHIGLTIGFFASYVASMLLHSRTVYHIDYENDRLIRGPPEQKDIIAHIFLRIFASTFYIACLYLLDYSNMTHGLGVINNLLALTAPVAFHSLLYNYCIAPLSNTALGMAVSGDDSERPAGRITSAIQSALGRMLEGMFIAPDRKSFDKIRADVDRGAERARNEAAFKREEGRGKKDDKSSGFGRESGGMDPKAVEEKIRGYLTEHPELAESPQRLRDFIIDKRRAQGRLGVWTTEAEQLEFLKGVIERWDEVPWIKGVEEVRASEVGIENWEQIAGGGKLGDNRIALIDFINEGRFFNVVEARYRDGSYKAKFTPDSFRQDRFLVPQAEIIYRLNRLKIPGICEAEHFIETTRGARIILFKKFPKGETLKNKILRLKKLPEKEAADITLRAARIVKRLHDEGIYHWDIKPGNIWVADKGDIILFDFDLSFRTMKEFFERGINKAWSAPYASQNRVMCRLLGYYPADSEFPAEAERDEVYALGMSLTHSLLGLVPIKDKGMDPEEYADDLLDRLTNRRDIPLALRRILEKAVTDGNSAYENVDAFIRDIEEYRAEDTKEEGRGQREDEDKRAEGQRSWIKERPIYQVMLKDYAPVDCGMSTFAYVKTRIPDLAKRSIGTIWLTGVASNKSRASTETGTEPFCVLDPMRVEAAYGTEEELRNLIETAHEYDIKVMTDFIPNHVSRESPLCGEQPDGFIRDERGDIVTATDKRGFHEFAGTAQFDYLKAWWRDYQMRVAMRWIELGVDAFRLDTPLAPLKDKLKANWYRGREAEVDKVFPEEFWKMFIDKVREKDPHIAFLAETIDLAEPYRDILEACGVDLTLDALFSHKLYHVLKGNRPPSDFIGHFKYVAETGRARRMVYFKDGHDIRDISHHGGDIDVLRYLDKDEAMLFGLLMATSPGVPFFYNGEPEAVLGYAYRYDRINPIPWDNYDKEARRFNDNLLRLAAMPVLREGSIKFLDAKAHNPNPNIVSFVRELNGEKVIVAANLGKDVNPANGRSWVNLDVDTLLDKDSSYYGIGDIFTGTNFGIRSAGVLREYGLVVALRPREVQILRLRPAGEPKWIKGIRLIRDRVAVEDGTQIIIDPNLKDDEVRLFGRHTVGTFNEVSKAQYRGEVYWAKTALNTENEISSLLPQAAILNYLNSLDIPGICKASHFIELDYGKKMILFEKFPPGKTLREKLEYGVRMPEKEAVALILDISRIVKRLHEAGVYHWDIKPENIWVTDTGDVILFDFDLAFRTKEEFLDRRLDSPGTPQYMSQDRFAGDIGGLYEEDDRVFSPARHEVYSIAMTLFHMLIDARTMYPGDIPRQYTGDILDQLAAADTGIVSQELKEVLKKALDAGRCYYRSVDEFIEAVETAEAHGTMSQSGTSPSAAAPGAVTDGGEDSIRFNSLLSIIHSTIHGESTVKFLIPLIKDPECLEGGKFYKRAVKYISAIFHRAIREEGLSRDAIAVRFLYFDPSPLITANVIHLPEEKKIIAINKAYASMIAFQLKHGYEKIRMADKKSGRMASLVKSEIYSTAIHEIRAHIKSGLSDPRAQSIRGRAYRGITIAAIIYYWSMIMRVWGGKDAGLTPEEFEEFINDTRHRIKSFLADNPQLTPSTDHVFYLDEIERIERSRFEEVLVNEEWVFMERIPRPDIYDTMGSKRFTGYIEKNTAYSTDKYIYESLPRHIPRPAVVRASVKTPFDPSSVLSEAADAPNPVVIRDQDGLTKEEIDSIARFLVREDIVKRLPDESEESALGRALEYIHDLQKTPGKESTVAFKDGAVVGMVEFSIAGDRGILNSIKVSEFYRRRHIATMLLDRAEAIMREAGALIYSVTVSGEEPAQQFWRRRIPPAHQHFNEEGVLTDGLIPLSGEDERKEDAAALIKKATEKINRPDPNDPTGFFDLESAFTFEGVTREQRIAIIETLLYHMHPPLPDAAEKESTKANREYAVEVLEEVLGFGKMAGMMPIYKTALDGIQPMVAKLKGGPFAEQYRDEILACLTRAMLINEGFGAFVKAYSWSSDPDKRAFGEQIMEFAGTGVEDTEANASDGVAPSGMASQTEPVSKEMPVDKLIESLHNLTATAGVAQDAKIFLSTNLFNELDGENLKRLLKGTNMKIAEPAELRRRAINGKVTKDKLVIVLTKEDFDDKTIWKGSDRENWIRSSVLILDDKLTGSNYLYVEGVIGLAGAIMRQDQRAIRSFYKLLGGLTLSDEILNTLKDNPVAFAVKAVLKFKPIEVRDPEELERYKSAMEKYLVMA